MSTAASAAERLGSGGKPELDDDDDDEPSELATLLGPGGAGRSAASGALPLLQDRCPAWYGAVMGSHADALSLFCSARYRVPMAVVWFTALGGAMHEPAVPYFYLSLGLSAAQIGQAGGILTAGSLLLAPVYGWLFDKRSAHLALVLAISLCGGGCLLRALATGPGTVLLSAVVMSVDGSFESLVLAYVARDQPVAASGGSRGGGRLTKAAVISAFLVQVQLTRIFGRGETTILSNSFHFPRACPEPVLANHRFSPETHHQGRVFRALPCVELVRPPAVPPGRLHCHRRGGAGRGGGEQPALALSDCSGVVRGALRDRVLRAPVAVHGTRTKWRWRFVTRRKNPCEYFEISKES